MQAMLASNTNRIQSLALAALFTVNRRREEADDHAAWLAGHHHYCAIRDWARRRWGNDAALWLMRRSMGI